MSTMVNSAGQLVAANYNVGNSMTEGLYAAHAATKFKNQGKDDGAERGEAIDDDAPTQEEIIEYAKYLGMDPVADHDLLYIAQWAIQAELPSGWTEHYDQEGNEFYHNAVTGVSTYEHPMDDQFRGYYRALKAQRGGTSLTDSLRQQLAVPPGAALRS